MKHTETENENLTERQEKVIPFLVSCPSIDAAAKESGVGRSTIHKWITENQAFRDAVRRGRDMVARAAFDAIRNHIDKAVATLAELLDSENDNVRRRAARDILDMSVKIAEVHEIEERLDSIEEAIENRGIS